MIIRQSKIEDLNERFYYLTLMEECLREGLLITAKQCGENARMFGERSRM